MNSTTRTLHPELTHTSSFHLPTLVNNQPALRGRRPVALRVNLNKIKTTATLDLKPVRQIRNNTLTTPVNDDSSESDLLRK